MMCLICGASRTRIYITACPAEIRLLLGLAERSAFPGEDFYEKLETTSFTESSTLRFGVLTNPHLADRFVRLVAREGFCRSGCAEKSRTAWGCSDPTRA